MPFAPAVTILSTSFQPSANGLAMFELHHLPIESMTLLSTFKIGERRIVARPIGNAIETIRILPSVLNKASAPLTNAFQPFFKPASICDPNFSTVLTALPKPLAIDLPKLAILLAIPFTNSRNFALCLYSPNSATPSTVIAVIIIPNGLVNKNLPAVANAEPSPRKAPPNLVRLDAPTTPSLNIIFLPTSNAAPPKSISV